MTLESLNGKIILCETLYRYIIERKRMKNIGLYICAYYTYIYIYTYKEEGKNELITVLRKNAFTNRI